MSNYALLNNVEHKDLKIRTEKSSELGNNQMFSILFPFEYKEAQAHYPIFFQKDSEGEFVSIALFGFEKGENLYLSDSGWDAEYIPLMVEKDPFLIGFQNQMVDGEQKQETVIHIDLDSPRVNNASGAPVFLPHGGNSDFLKRISAILKTIYDAQDASKKFISRITELDLLESVNVDINMRDGSVNRLAGLFTIDEDKVKQLSGDVLEDLNAQGMLSLIFMVIASQVNVRKIAALKNARS